MVVTLTLNPSLDYYLNTELKIGAVNRAVSEKFTAGGKGINVSRVLHKLGTPTLGLGFVGGWTGVQIHQSCLFDTDFVKIDGNSRINVKICGEIETEINAKGPLISPVAIEELLAKADDITENDVIVLNGSLPPNLSEDFYVTFAKKTHSKHIIVDTSGAVLLKTLEIKPFLVKPNHLELGEVFNVNLDKNDIDNITLYAKKLQNMGAENVLVSLGSVGALLLTKEDTFFEKTTPVPLTSSVGAGDTLLSLFISHYFQNLNFPAALKFAVQNVAEFI